MTASYDSVAQGYVFQVPDKDLELTVWIVQSIKTLAAQLGVTVYDKTGYCRVLILQPSMLSSYVPQPHTPAQTGQTGQRQVAQQRLASMSCRYTLANNAQVSSVIQRYDRRFSRRNISGSIAYVCEYTDA